MGFQDIGLSILTAAVFTLCNVGAKVSLDSGREWLMYLVYPGSILAFWLFRKLCMTNGLAIASSIVDSLIGIVSVLIAVFVIGEVLAARQYVGLALVFGGLYLLR